MDPNISLVRWINLGDLEGVKEAIGRNADPKRGLLAINKDNIQSKEIFDYLLTFFDEIDMDILMHFSTLHPYYLLRLLTFYNCDLEQLTITLDAQDQFKQVMTNIVYLLRYGLDVNSIVPIIFAMDKHRDDITEIYSGLKNFNYQVDGHMLALYMQSGPWDYKLVENMLIDGASPNIYGDYQAPLLSAVYSNDYATIALLADFGAEFTSDIREKIKLHNAALLKSDNPTVADVLKYYRQAGIINADGLYI